MKCNEAKWVSGPSQGGNWLAGSHVSSQVFPLLKQYTSHISLLVYTMAIIFRRYFFFCGCFKWTSNTVNKIQGWLIVNTSTLNASSHAYFQCSHHAAVPFRSLHHVTKKNDNTLWYTVMHGFLGFKCIWLVLTINHPYVSAHFVSIVSTAYRALEDREATVSEAVEDPVNLSYFLELT